MNLEDIKKMNIFEKIHAVMSEVSTVAKNGKNDFHKYSYAKEADYVEAIRPLLAKYRIAVVPQAEILMPSTTNEGLVNLKMHFIMVNIDKTDETTNATIISQGQDKGDKAAYKAITGAKKYFIANTFMIATHDDPEADSPEVKREAKSSGFRKAKSETPVAEKTNVEPLLSEKKPTSFRKTLVKSETTKKVVNDDF